MIYLFLADGFEETEALVTVDVLRRAEYEIKTVGVGKDTVTGTHGICVKADISEAEVVLDDELEAVILPGGMPGTLNLKGSEKVKEAVLFANENGKTVGAICAAPSVLGEWGLLKGKTATCYPGFEEALVGAEVCDAPCVISDNIVTAKGAGTVFEFSFALVDIIAWREGRVQFGDCSLSSKIEESMQCAR